MKNTYSIWRILKKSRDSATFVFVVIGFLVFFMIDINFICGHLVPQEAVLIKDKLIFLYKVYVF